MLKTAQYGYVSLDDIVQVYNPADAAGEVDWDGDSPIAVRFGSQVVSGKGIAEAMMVTDPDVKQAIREHCENPGGIEISLEGLRASVDSLPDKIKEAFGGGGLGAFLGGGKK